MTISPGGIPAVLAVAAGVMCAAQAVVAGESGSFAFIESAVHDYTTLEHAGHTVTVGPLRGTATVAESSGGLFAEGESYGTVCLVYVRRTDAGIDLEAPCTYTDSSGDQWYGLSKRRAGDVEVGGGGQGMQRIVGGTGKYAGVTGNCPYTTRYMPDNWLVAMATCDWQTP